MIGEFGKISEKDLTDQGFQLAGSTAEVTLKARQDSFRTVRLGDLVRLVAFA